MFPTSICTMLKSYIKSLALVVLAALAVVAPTAVRAQVTTAGMSGLIRGSDGNPVNGAVVVAVYTPTNASYSAKANSDGRFYFRGLPIGGPYAMSVTADGFQAQQLNEVNTQLGQDITVNFTLRSDVVKLEKFVVSGARSDLDASAFGSGQVLDSNVLANKATARRSLNELVSTNPAVTLRAINSGTGREDAMITAAGQNNRFNSWMIDGNRINDTFGLYESGTLAFFNPLSIDTLEQISVQLSPYDTRYGGFTGASINMVTKSGTNQFHGEVYYIANSDHIAGVQLEGPNDSTLVNTGVKKIPHLDQSTKAFYLGGPLWKDHVFFFVNWERYDRNNAPSPSGLSSVDATDLATIVSRVAQIKAINYGAPGSGAVIRGNDEKKLLKLDWQINSLHRLTARYSSTNGYVPLFGNLTSTSVGSGLNNNASPALVGGAGSAFDSHFYAQNRIEKNESVQLVSQWTPDFKTELKWSGVKQDQYTPVNVVAPEIDVFGVHGVNQAGQSVSNGVMFLGTERFRHGNIIHVNTKNYTGTADYHQGNLTYTAGADIELNDFYNLFRSFSYGVFQYATPADFANDLPRFFQRNFTDLALKGSYADVSQWGQHGIFGNVKWEPSSRFNLTAGLRYDWTTSTTHPVFNPQFLSDTGMRNDGTVDGANEISPRFGFNWAADDERKTQVHGGIGYFVGRAPWVWWSNSYGQTGLGTYTVTTLPTGGLNGYLANSFDPKVPNGTGTQTGAVRSEIDLADAGMHMPALWRGNLTVDHKLSLLDTVLTLDITHSMNDHTLFLSNDNLKPLGVAADGRTYFAGSPSSSNTAFAKYPNYFNILHLSNKRGGEATYTTLSWNRPMRNNWSFNLAYTRGNATDLQNNAGTTASGSLSTMVFNANQPEVATSDFEIKDRVQLLLSREFKIIRNWKTTASIYYEGRTGNPFSYSYSNDMNGDGQSGNDLIAVPSGPTDPRFNFTGMSQTQMDAMFAYIQSTGLSKYSGGHVPKNAFYESWQNRLDLSLKQEIPIYGHARVKLFADFVNFGNFVSKKLFNYVERSLLNSNDVFDRVSFGSATVDPATGLIKMSSVTTPSGVMVIDDQASRWRIQAGAAIEF